jgi:hypothetical protein
VTALRIPLLAAASVPLTIGHAARVYYVNQPENLAGHIIAVNPDGTGHTTLWSAPAVTDLRGIAVDPANARLFFAHSRQDPITLARTEVSLRTMPMAGGEPTVVAMFPDDTSLADVEFDASGPWIYVARPSSLELQRSRVDGSAVETVLTHQAAQTGPYFVGLDLANRHAYWGVVTQPDDTNTAYSRGTLDGVLDTEFSLVTPSRTRDIAVDSRTPGRARLYWCDRQNGAVYSRLASGGSITAARTGLNAPHGLVLDLEAGKGYVADTGKRGSGSQPSSHRVVRFDLDGSGVVEFLSPAGTIPEPWDVAVDLTSTTYADWSRRFFSSGAGNAGSAMDADGDGRGNAAEYAFFSHPLRADAMVDTSTPVGTGIRFARRKTSDVAVRVEASTDLATWHWNDESPSAVWTAETSIEPRDEDSEWITVGPAGPLVGASRIHYRLRAVGP